MIIASISIIMINKREHCVDNINSRDEDIKFTVFLLSDQSIIMLKMTEIAHKNTH